QGDARVQGLRERDHGRDAGARAGRAEGDRASGGLGARAPEQDDGLGSTPIRSEWSSEPARHPGVMKKPREPRRVQRVRERAGAASQRGRDWAERQQPGSRAGVAISAWRHYRAVDGPLQSALLSLYILVAVLPALLVMEEYLDKHPNSLAN